MAVIYEIESRFRIGSNRNLEAVLSERAREELQASRIVINDYQRYRSGLGG
jgi:hypothetical protein